MEGNALFSPRQMLSCLVHSVAAKSCFSLHFCSLMHLNPFTFITQMTLSFRCYFSSILALDYTCALTKCTFTEGSAALCCLMYQGKQGHPGRGYREQMKRRFLDTLKVPY